MTHGYVRDQLLALLPGAEIKCFVIAREREEDARRLAGEKPDGTFKAFSREDVEYIRELPSRGEGGGPSGRDL